MKNKNKMKKLVVLLAAAALFSCKKEDPQQNLCDCVDVTYQLGNNYSGWHEIERSNVTKKDGWKHGETEEWIVTYQYSMSTQKFKRVTECK